MVVPTPKKPLFEGNYPSNSQPLFFEFAFEPTTVSFKPQANLAPSSSLPTKSKRKKLFFAASRLAFGLFITALIMGSGILNNELFMGKSAIQADLTWIPTWAEEAPTKVVNIAENVKTSETMVKPEAILVSSLSEANIAAEPELNPEAPLASTEKENSSTLTEPIVLAEAPEATMGLKETKPVILNKPSPPTEPIKKEAAPFRPIIKNPVTQRGVKLSSPVMNPTTKSETKSTVTSEAFHQVNAQAAIDGKKVFIKFGARWCLPCKMMEANVFPDPEISQLLAENYHVLTVDVDNLDGINLRQFYQVEALPSFIILDDHQNILAKHDGAKRIEELRSILGTVHP